jgi:WD40 repeat protein
LKTVAFGPDGKSLLTLSTNGRARLWEVKLGKPIDIYLPERKALQIKRVVFSPDARSVVRLFQYHSEGQLCDVATGKPIGRVRHPEGADVESVAFSPDSKTLVTSGEEDEGATARLWAVATGRQIGRPLRHHDKIEAVSFSGDGEIVLTGSADQTVRLWSAATGKPIGKPFRHSAKVRCVALSPDGKILLTTTWDDNVRLWNAATGRALRPVLHTQGSPFMVAFNPDGRTFLTACKEGKVQLWETASGKAIGAPLDHPGKVYAAAYGPDGKRLVTAWGGLNKNTGGARFWEAATGKPIGQPLSHKDAVNTVAFSPDGKMLVTGSADYTARLWDVATGKPIGPALRDPMEPTRRDVSSRNPSPTEEENMGVLAVGFSPDGKTVLTAGESNAVRIWKVPLPVKGSLEQIRLWVQVATGMELDSGGGIQPLQAATWQSRSKLLAELGNNLGAYPTIMAPLEERRPRLAPPGDPGAATLSLTASAVGG